jgi:hypothetical protein
MKDEQPVSRFRPPEGPLTPPKDLAGAHNLNPAPHAKAGGHAPVFPQAAFHAFDDSIRFGGLRPHMPHAPNPALRRSREHARGRHSS